jgi:hypothetical protein
VLAIGDFPFVVYFVLVDSPSADRRCPFQTFLEGTLPQRTGEPAYIDPTDHPAAPSSRRILIRLALHVNRKNRQFPLFSKRYVDRGDNDIDRESVPM